MTAKRQISGDERTDEHSMARFVSPLGGWGLSVVQPYKPFFDFHIHALFTPHATGCVAHHTHDSAIGAV